MASSILAKLLATLPSAMWVKVVELMASLGPRALSSLSDEARIRMINALRRVTRFLQTGFDVGWQYSVTGHSVRAAIATLALANVYRPWAEAGWAARTAEELTKMSGSGADVDLISRLLDALVAHQLFLKTGDQYRGWPGSWADDLVKDPTLASHFLGFYDWSSGVMTNLPRYLAATGFANPADTRASNFHHLYGPTAEAYKPPLGDAAVFARLKVLLAADATLKAQLARVDDDDAAAAAAALDALIDAQRAPLLGAWAHEINDFMESHSRYNHRPWTALVATRPIVADARPDRALVVDIGGGKGHDALRFAALHPDIADGSVVVQDLPHVLREGARTLAGQRKVVARAYDYLEPQPIRGARVYYIHVVLHNADDQRAIAVLANVVDAMDKGYSQLLIHESVVDEENPHAVAACQDIFMMGLFAAQERTRDKWAYVVQEAGLAIREIKMQKGFPDAVIVADKV